ncbi:MULTISPECIES: pilin [Marinobacter]|uniref:pilin n=1 Tax=Marinobacter TaxID=2742 RepID=UPI0029432985|nr:pilin [Marinobacter salarius]WOI21253.1 pilin [Marinobacter salarius]
MSSIKGFTLIELMIVIVIVGILSALAIPVYQNYVARAQLSEAMTISGGIRSEIASTFMGTTGTFVGIDSGSSGIPVAADVQGSYVESVSVTDGIVSVTLGNEVSGFLSGEILTLTPTTTPGDTIIWSCSFTGSTRYLPQSCP